MFKRANQKQLDILKSLKESPGSSDQRSSEPHHAVHDSLKQVEPKKEPTIPKQKSSENDWVHELVEDFHNPKRLAQMDHASCLASITSAYRLIKEKQRMKAQKETETVESHENESDEEETNEERQHREAWTEGFEKLRRIMELERISGNSYLHLELDSENDKLKVEVAHQQEKRFADWVGSVIDEHEKIQSFQGWRLSTDTVEGSQLEVNEETSSHDQLHVKKKVNDHHVWIKQMIREIIVLDQTYDLETVIKSVQNYTEFQPPEHILETVTEIGSNNAVRTTVLQTISDLIEFNEGGSDSEEPLEPSDEDVSKKEEEPSHKLPLEQEMILREISKTEKEITKDCHDLASYVQKCRDNTKLYCLYKGDTPQKWRFLNIKPNENKLRFKYKALIHIMFTMSKLQDDFKKEMDRLQEEEIDYTKVLSDNITIEELNDFQLKSECTSRPKGMSGPGLNLPL